MNQRSQHRRSIFWLSILLVFACTQCVDPIDIDIDDPKPLLVVDGLISNQPGPYTVKLSQSSPINSFEFTQVSQAEVIIEAENGEQEVLREDTTGIYKTAVGGIQGVEGKRYRLKINLANGNQYTSDWELLKAAPPIDSIYFRYEAQQTARGLQQGAAIFLDASDPESLTQFYRWEWESTWLFVAPLSSGLKFLGNDEVEFVPHNEVCWNTGISQNIHVASSVGNATDAIAEFPLSFIPGYGLELRSRYSLLVKQFALTEKEFLYWRGIKEANENSGSLYDTQPQSSTGNISNINDPGEPVLGYFSVSGQTEKRIFIERFDLPLEAAIGFEYTTNCFLQSDTLIKGEDTEADVFEAIEKGQVFYDFYRIIDIVGWILTSRDCADCTYMGGTTEKPDFWD